MAKVATGNGIVRISAAMLAFSCLGFVSGYFGPIYLLPDPGVGPLTALFSTPLGAVIGAGAAVHATVRGLSGVKYFLRLAAVAAAYAGAILLLVVTQ